MDAVAHQCNAMLLNNIQGFSTKTRVWNNSMNIFCRSNFFPFSQCIHSHLARCWNWFRYMCFMELEFTCEFYKFTLSLCACRWNYRAATELNQQILCTIFGGNNIRIQMDMYVVASRDSLAQWHDGWLARQFVSFDVATASHIRLNDTKELQNPRVNILACR